MKGKCADDPNAAAERLELFSGDASDALARVYARLPCNETTTGGHLSGELIGPECRFAQTLSARIPFHDCGPGESLLAEAVVPDPCFWTPELPMLYRAQIQGRAAGDGERLLEVARLDAHGVVVPGHHAPKEKPFAAIQRWMGIRRLGMRGRSFILDAKRWVPRGASLERIDGDALTAAREANVVLCGPPPDDSICLEASWQGVPLLIDLPPMADNLAEELRRLARWPAVFVVILDSHSAVDTAIRAAGKNLILVAKFAADDHIQPPAWAQAIVCDASPQIAQRVAACPLPILASRRDSIGIASARTACDRLQYDLASTGDFAGYLV